MLVRAAGVLRDRGGPGIAFVLVGDGPDKSRCERLAADLGLTDDTVVFVPPVPKREVPGVLQALDVTLFPLRDVPVFRYGLSSNKLFDYLASGRPVICASGLADNPVRASGGGICVQPEDPDAVADALAELAAAGPAGRQAIGERGRSWVYRHHDVTMLADRFLRALESVAE
jgi:glycosyltransferase involved in cell wall biosynthesis